MNSMIEAFDTIEAQVLHLIDLNTALRQQCASLQSQLQAQVDRPPMDESTHQQLAERDQAIAQRDQLMAQYQQAIDERDQLIAQQERAIAENQDRIVEYQHVIAQREEVIGERDLQLKEFRERMNQAQQRVRKALEILPPHTPDLFEQDPPVA